MFILVIVGLVIYALISGHTVPTFAQIFRSIFKAGKFTTGFVSGFVVTGCLGIIALPLIIALICRLTLLVIGF